MSKSKSRKRKKTKVQIIVQLCLIAAIIGAVLFFMFRPNNAAANAGTVESYVVSADTATIAMDVELSGTITPIEIDEHNFVADSKVEKIYVEKGDYVTKGTLLAELDTSNLELALLQAEENYASLQLSGSPSALRQAELKLDAAQTALDDARLYASIDGYVSSIDFEEDKYVTANQKIRIVDTTGYTTTTSIDESEMHKIFIGQEVEMIFDVVPNKTFIGYISDIPLEGNINSQGFSVFEVEVTVQDPEGELASPYSFTGDITSDETQTIVIVPNGAVYENDNGDKYVLKVINGDQENPETAMVTTEFYSGTQLRVIAGVDEGDQLLVQPQSSSSSSFMVGMPGTGGGGGGGRPR